MMYLLAAAVFLYLFWCKPTWNKLHYADGSYISHERTMIINGIFILLVFLAHAKSYIPMRTMSVWNVDFIQRVIQPTGQLMVAGFFFYSGFGIMESVRRKGDSYMKTFLRKRFLKVLLTFDIAVGIFSYVRYSLGTVYSWDHYLLALIGWKAVGCSCWFIFVTLCLYLLFWLGWLPYCWSSRLSAGKRTFLHMLTFLVLVLGLYLFLKEYSADATCRFNTLWVFPAGCLYSIFHKQIVKGVLFTHIPPTLIGIAFVVVGYQLGNWTGAPKNWELYNFRAILYALGIVMTLSQIEFKRTPELLKLAGAALFSVYIFQRLPMLWFIRTKQIKADDDMFFLFTFVATLLLACIAEPVFKGVGKLLNGRSKAPTPATQEPAPQKAE